MAVTLQSGGFPWLHVRREPFDYGLLPLPSLVHNEGVASLIALREKLFASSTSTQSTSGRQSKRVGAPAIASTLGLPELHAQLLLDTVAAVLPDDISEADSLAHAAVTDVGNIGADVEHVLLLLYIQSYRRAAHRPLPTSPALADIWPPAPSPFDNYTPAVSPLMQVKTGGNGRQRTMPGQCEEEANQLAFVLKHLSSLVNLLADPLSPNEDESSRVISGEKLDYLGLLLRTGGARSGMPLRQATPFFAESDPAMPAAPVPVSQVHEWLSRHVCGASEHMREGSESPVAGLSMSGLDEDVSMAEASSSSGSPGTGGASVTVPGVASNGLVPPSRDFWPAGITCVDGVAKMSVLKGEGDIEGGTVRISHCHDAVVYVLAPLKYAQVIGCSDSTIVLGPVGKAVKAENCERVQLITACARIRISTCRECVFYLGTNQSPVVAGDNHKLQVAPYNTFYPRLEAHLTQVGVDPTMNRWDSPLALGAADPHDAMSHPAGVASSQAEGAALLPPDKFVPFVVPFRGGGESHQHAVTRGNPFPLPKPYLTALQVKTNKVESLRQTLKTAVLEDNKKKELTNVILAHFKEWLLSSGNIRQVYDLARFDRDP